MRAAPILFCLLGAFALSASDGLPPRHTADSYPNKGEANGLVVGVEVMDPDRVRSEFSTSLVPDYLVVEVALYPPKGSTLDIVGLDFGLRVDGRLIRPAVPRTIAGMNQKRSNARGRDIVLWPSVGVSTGTYGTGTNVGVGVGTGGGAPGPASTDRDRRIMETELEDRSLQEGAASGPVAGYLFFPAGRVQSGSMEFVYQHNGAELKIPIAAPKKK